VDAIVAGIAAASWNARIALIRKIPEDFGKAQHQAVYAAIAKTVYATELAPDFAYMHWRDEYELKPIERAYEKAFALTSGFAAVDPATLACVMEAEPSTTRIFRLLLGFTIKELAASTTIVAEQIGAPTVSESTIKTMEAGRGGNRDAADVLAATVDQAMHGRLFSKTSGSLRSKIEKPDTVHGWATVRKYATESVPLPVFLHQRHYGGAFRQLLDATSGKRGDLLEDAVESLLTENDILFLRTGSTNQAAIAADFGLTVKPAPDFVVYDKYKALRAILECKQANDGGTARDKAARFAALRSEAVRLGGVPLFAVLAGLGWQRTADTLGPVVRDTDGRVFTIKTLEAMMTVEPFGGLRRVS
jgi:hypothetical protein